MEGRIMTKAEARDRLIRSLEIDVSWGANRVGMTWDGELPNLTELGIDDEGDLYDYLLGVRDKVREVIRGLVT